MKKRFYLYFFIIFFVSFVIDHLYAENLTIQFNKNTYSNGKFQSYFSLNGNISYDTVDAIQNGITAKFHITFQLTKSEGFLGLAQNVIKERVESFFISYDVWENTFIIQDKVRNNSYYADRAGNIVKKIYEIINPVTIDLSSIKENDQMTLRAKIYIQTIKLYPPFGIFLYFFDPWNYESNWIYTEPFILNKL